LKKHTRSEIRTNSKQLPDPLFQLSAKPKKVRSSSFASCNVCKSQSIRLNLHSKPQPFEVTPEKESLKSSADFPNFLLSSDVKLGNRIIDLEKMKVLKKIYKEAINFESEKILLKFYYNEYEKTFNILPLGDSAPLSECCGSGLVVQVSCDYGGKVICPQRNCFISCLTNFFIEKQDLQILWSTPQVNFFQKRKKISGNSGKTLDFYRERLGISRRNIFNTPKGVNFYYQI
jgi:hypothetical protein